ncbi:MAG: 1-(5-phosphoribosyl)-5-[(5-phosphoribosylamino)methylideneamino]imidazole-4-carboxamide isomerase [Gammaproteobacteria bacterium]|nr:1-(5-phosphoribosyl)-5-[(5-phosphoribosylamino)methylideneamino]imidazole-4-carboxamide isomerase [Gammaproteobacteria bacterium]
MQLIPAIDLKDGRCVRLRQGRMEDSTEFSNDPVAMARQWVDAGARRLHLVDLNGAFAGTPVNHAVIKAIVNACPNIPIQVGGGLRDAASVARYLDMGVRYTIIGTKAVQDPDFVRGLCEQFTGQIIVGIDAKDGKVAVDGWATLAAITAIELAKKFEHDGVEAIIYTDINRDGMLHGVNIESTVNLARAVNIPIIASGGITNLEDIRALCAVAHEGIAAAITGRAIYEGTLDFAQAQQLTDQLQAGN